uniref:Reverse transcriptase zinc-binding domain-containing protein n=1 Tax=Arundo donax TaxID=35708 RepID=A0A0A8Z0V1_ARUDO
MFDMATVSAIGDGNGTKFWTDRWLQGKNIIEMASHLTDLVSRQAKNQRTVSQALDSGRWVRDIQGSPSVIALDEYLQLWNILSSIQLQPGVPDQHIWKLTRSGSYLSKSAYKAYFSGSTSFAPWKRIWKSWAPLRCKFFLWLAILNRCWTGDRLAKRGLPHPMVCPLCDQAEESINHLLISCVFAKQFWFCLLQKLGLQHLAPQSVTTFSSWWCKAIKGVDKQ